MGLLCGLDCALTSLGLPVHWIRLYLRSPGPSKSSLSSQAMAQGAGFRVDLRPGRQDIRGQRPGRLGWLPRGEEALKGRSFTNPLTNKNREAQRGKVTVQPVRVKSVEA